MIHITHWIRHLNILNKAIDLALLLALSLPKDSIQILRHIPHLLILLKLADILLHIKIIATGLPTIAIAQGHGQIPIITLLILILINDLIRINIISRLLILIIVIELVYLHLIATL